MVLFGGYIYIGVTLPILVLGARVRRRVTQLGTLNLFKDRTDISQQCFYSMSKAATLYRYSIYATAADGKSRRAWLARGQ